MLVVFFLWNICAYDLVHHVRCHKSIHKISSIGLHVARYKHLDKNSLILCGLAIFSTSCLNIFLHVYLYMPTCLSCGQICLNGHIYDKSKTYPHTAYLLRTLAYIADAETLRTCIYTFYVTYTLYTDNTRGIRRCIRTHEQSTHHVYVESALSQEHTQYVVLHVTIFNVCCTFLYVFSISLYAYACLSFSMNISNVAPMHICGRTYKYNWTHL